LAGASVPGAAIEDRLQLASGAPENFIPLVGYATAQLAGLKEGGIEFEDSSLSVYGQAESSIAYENVLDAMAATLPGAQLRRLEVEPPLASPFAWSLSRRDGLVTLDGHAPSRAKRDTIAADIRNAMSGTQIDNRLSIARGLPQDVDWTPATAHLARLLAEMATGTITVSDGMVSVDGDAASPQAFETVNAALDRELPAGLRLASAQIRRPVVEPYVWAIETAKGGAVTLSGYAPAPDTASRLAETVRGIVGEDGGFRDGQQIASGAPEGFEAAASATRFALGRLPDMRASLTGKTLRVEGEALTGTAANEIRSLIAAALPEGYALDAAIAIRPPGTSIDASACHAELAGQLQRASVRFETGSADISTRSLGLLDSLAFTLRRCPETRFEVGGHTDSDGIEEANLELSTARARAIADWLIRSGVRYSRLVAKGYGESRPVADNATPEGKARNRRIEFRVLQ
ncbi:MAG: OmpA family protein, partial [Pseudomonadota bacterium]|nr:OmpA family protein [Pseudomonadota bacterium]